jgi:deazaflavin-dependent oxidoreductase (nitroreductase family)
MLQNSFIWRVMRRVNQRVVRAYATQNNLSRPVLLLTTTGRRSGLPRVTPLQYEAIDGTIYVAAARGQKADWFRNIVAHPQVEIQIGTRRFRARAEPIADPSRIAEFLETRRTRHPQMIGAMLLLHGWSPRADRQALEKLAQELALVALHPREQN